MEPFRLFKAKLETCIYNLNSSGLSLRTLHNSEEIISSTGTEVSDSSSHLPQGQEDPELIHIGHEFKTNFPENIKDPAVIDSVVAALQLEVEQLTASLASKSKVGEFNLIIDLCTRFFTIVSFTLIDDVIERSPFSF